MLDSVIKNIKTVVRNIVFLLNYLLIFLHSTIFIFLHYMHWTSHRFPHQDVLGCFQCQSVSTWSKMLLKKSTIRALIKGQVSQKISSDSSFCANWRSLPLARAGPVVPRPSDQVATGHLQVPLVPGEDPHTVISGAEAQRVQLLQLKRHKTGRRGSKAAIKIKKKIH